LGKEAGISSIEQYAKRNDTAAEEGLGQNEVTAGPGFTTIMRELGHSGW
jgi:hypothetical protein